MKKELHSLYPRLSAYTQSIKGWKDKTYNVNSTSFVLAYFPYIRNESNGFVDGFLICFNGVGGTMGVIRITNRVLRGDFLANVQFVGQVMQMPHRNG